MKGDSKMVDDCMTLDCTNDALEGEELCFHCWNMAYNSEYESEDCFWDSQIIEWAKGVDND